MIIQCLQPLKAIPSILHPAFDIAEHIDKLLLAAIVVLALDASEVVAPLRSCVLFGSSSEKRLAVLELFLIEGCEVLTSEAAAAAHDHLSSALRNPACTLSPALGLRWCTSVLTCGVIDLLE